MSAHKKLFGTNLDAPQGIAEYGVNPQGLILLLNNIFRVAIFAAGIFALINFAVSGIQYIGSSGNPETTKKASSRIWFSMLGLVIVAATTVIAALIGLIFFGSPTAIISPTIYGPGVGPGV